VKRAQWLQTQDRSHPWFQGSLIYRSFISSVSITKSKYLTSWETATYEYARGKKQKLLLLCTQRIHRKFFLQSIHFYSCALAYLLKVLQLPLQWHNLMEITSVPTGAFSELLLPTVPPALGFASLHMLTVYVTQFLTQTTTDTCGIVSFIPIPIQYPGFSFQNCSHSFALWIQQWSLERIFTIRLLFIMLQKILWSHSPIKC
jgi:hypothetical protein